LLFTTATVESVNPFTGEFIWNKPVFGRVYSSCPVKRFATMMQRIRRVEFGNCKDVLTFVVSMNRFN